MPKPRAPIATRLRNKTKNNQQPSLSQNEGEINQESCSQNTANDRQTSSPPQDKGSETFPPHKPKYCQDSFPQSKHSRTSSSTRSSSEESTTRDDSLSDTSTALDEERFPFSTRSDPQIYMDELHSPLSFVRGTTEELDKYFSQEQERLLQAFGNQYNPNIKISTFYQAQVSPPIPSKRTRHQSSDKKQQANSTPSKKPNV